MRFNRNIWRSAARRWTRTLFIAAVAAPSVHAAPVLLNEFNAVSATNQLDGGNGADTRLGTILGNGGNWFELLVVDDHTDMRGWKLDWQEDETNTAGAKTAGTITLSNDALWSDLRAGSFVTFIESVDADGHGAVSTATDVGYNPAAGDWWINVATHQEATRGAAALVTTTSNEDNNVPGDFSVGKDNWLLTLRNAAGTIVFGPSGEGGNWAGDGVGGDEAGSLEGPVSVPNTPVTIATWQAIGPDSDLYDDTSSTSFGDINVDYDRVTKTFTPNQDLAPLRALVGGNGKPGDFDGDGQLTAADIDTLSGAVRTGSTNVQFDLDGNGSVSDADRTHWVESLRKTFFGDANLDGEFNTADLVAVLGAGEYEDTLDANSTWATGDWSGDQEFTTSDLVVALQGGGYEQGPRAAVSAVPEPTSGMMGLLAMSGLLGHCYRQRRHYGQSFFTE